MPGELLELIGFTLLPLGALLVGIGLAPGASYVLRDRRVLLAGLLFALMASHQVTEIRRLFAGGDPHQRPQYTEMATVTTVPTRRNNGVPTRT